MSFQAYLDNIHANTGNAPEQFKTLATKAGVYKPDMKASALVVWLKGRVRPRSWALHGYLGRVQRQRLGRIAEGQEVSKPCKRSFWCAFGLASNPSLHPAFARLRPRVNSNVRRLETLSGQ